MIVGRSRPGQRFVDQSVILTLLGEPGLDDSGVECLKDFFGLQAPQALLSASRTCGSMRVPPPDNIWHDVRHKIWHTKKGLSDNSPHLFDLGAGNETRTRDPNLGKVVLYQLSYSRLRAQ